MSNPAALAAVTVTLRKVLFDSFASLPVVGGAQVTTRPPDKARLTPPDDQVNIFMFRTEIDAAWTNRDLPAVRLGEPMHSPLALNLHYLITAYGRDDDDQRAHQLLGKAMSVLHDRPLLGRAEIKAAMAAEFPASRSDLHDQVERVRFTPTELSLDALSKLWTAFQTQLRVSSTYEAAVVLIDDSQPVESPLPVLQRGRPLDPRLESLRGGDRGPEAATDPPVPLLEQVQTPPGRSDVLLGEAVVVSGRHLLDDPADQVTIRFTHPAIVAPIEVPATAVPGTAQTVEVTLPDRAADVPSGIWSVSATVARADGSLWGTNSLAVVVAPEIVGVPLSVALVAGGSAPLTVSCKPDVWPDQSALLLVGAQQFLWEHDALDLAAQPTGSLSFTLTGLQAGDYPLRLRVAGVDSRLVDRSVTPPIFDPNQKLTIT